MNAILVKFHGYLLTQKRVAQNTFSAYKRDIDQFIGYLCEQKKDFTTIDRDDVKEYIRYLKETLGLNARSITRKISSLKVLFLYLHEYHDVANLAQDLVFPKLEKKLPQYLTELEVGRLLSVAEQDTTDLGKRNKLLLYLLYVTGMRISELINTQLSHFHFDTGFIDVLGKGGKARMVPIPIPVIALVKEYMATVHATFADNGKRKTDFLFPTYYGTKSRPITRQAVWVILKDLCKKAGIERSVHPHQLRHSLATHMLKNGADLRSLQLLLGHENLATVQIYTHLETSHLRKIYDKKHPRS